MSPHLRLTSGNIFTDDRFEKVLFWNSASPILIITADGKILEVNDAICELLGYSSSELTRMSIIDIAYNPDGVRGIEMRRECISNERDEYSMEERYLTKKEKVVWVKSKTQSIRDSHGYVENFIITSIPLPNGGIYKVEKNEATGEVAVRPIVTIVQLLKDDWKTALGIGLFLIWTLFDKLKENLQMLLNFLHP